MTTDQRYRDRPARLLFHTVAGGAPDPGDGFRDAAVEAPDVTGRGVRRQRDRQEPARGEPEFCVLPRSGEASLAKEGRR